MGFPFRDVALQFETVSFVIFLRHFLQLIIFLVFVLTIDYFFSQDFQFNLLQDLHQPFRQSRYHVLVLPFNTSIDLDEFVDQSSIVQSIYTHFKGHDSLQYCGLSPQNRWRLMLRLTFRRAFEVRWLVVLPDGE